MPENFIQNSRKRPLGIIAVSVFLLALGAQIVGFAILTLSLDMHFLSTPSGASLRYLMFGFIFVGLSSAGFGTALYEGLRWARPASLFVLSFLSTLKLFNVVSGTFPSSLLSTDLALFLLCGISIVYLCLPQARLFAMAPASNRLNGPVRDTQAAAWQNASCLVDD